MLSSKHTANAFNRTLGLTIVAALLGWQAVASHAAEDRFAKVVIKTVQVTDHIQMLEGAGGNIGVSIGNDGTLIIDSQYAPMATKISNALRELGSTGPKYILNTHFHGDHSGGNAEFAPGAVVVAHANVRDRLLANPDIAASALPTVVFEDRLRLFVNGDAVDIVHLPHGHTDGDSFVWFQNQGVIHLGDHFFNGNFPFVDLNSGGTVGGYQRNLERVLLTVPSDVKVIPGHGPLADTAAVAAMVNMLRETQAIVAAAIADGVSVDDMVAKGLGRKYRRWGKGFITEERWIQTLYNDANSR